MADAILNVWREDIDVRTNGLERGQRGGQHARVRETKGGVVYDSAGLRVIASAVPHGEWRYAFAYRIETPTRRIVLSGDAAPNEALLAAASWPASLGVASWGQRVSRATSSSTETVRRSVLRGNFV